MEMPTEVCLHSAKRVVRYLKGIVNYGIHYKKGGKCQLLAYIDSDYAGDMEDRMFKKTASCDFIYH